MDSPYLTEFGGQDFFLRDGLAIKPDVGCWNRTVKMLHCTAELRVSSLPKNIQIAGGSFN